MEENTGISLFQGGSINVDNALQNQEEEEDLKDQQRRQKEIQSLLTKAMDDFDDQSTINSSTNVSLNETAGDALKYRDAGMDDQLKVLYKVRTNEVLQLSQQVENLKIELIQQKDALGKKYMLAEAERERTQLSLRQSQELLVLKTEEITTLHSQLDTFQISLKHMEDNLHMLEEERESLKHNNKDLMEQLTIMQKGIGIYSISDREMQEKHHTELSKMHHNLENALIKLERTESENKELERKLHESVQRRDELLADKTDVINRLTGNLENAQHQCTELLALVETVTKENQTLKRTTTNSELLNKMQSGLSDKTEIIKVLQKELESSNEIKSKLSSDFDHLQNVYSDLHKNFKIMEKELDLIKTENKVLLSNNEVLENNLKRQHQEIICLNEKLDKFNAVQAENEIFKKRIDSLQELVRNYDAKTTEEHSVQVSQIMTSFCEQNDLYKEENEKLILQLTESKEEIESLNRQIEVGEKEISTLLLKVSLEQEREQLISDLQEKACKFETMILERQQKSATVSTIGVNTDDILDDETLEAKYEAELIEKEIKLRTELTAEFQTKLEKALKSNSSLKDEKYEKLNALVCTKCPILSDQLEEARSLLIERLQKLDDLQCEHCPKLRTHLHNVEGVLKQQKHDFGKLRQQQVQDREMIANILEDWRDKFDRLEKENEHLSGELVLSNKCCDDLKNQVYVKEQQSKHLVDNLRKEAEVLIKETNQQAIQGIHKFTLTHRNKILESRKKIENISMKTDKKVKEIESRYKKSREAIEKAYRDCLS